MQNSKQAQVRSATDVIRAGCEESLAALNKYHARALKLEAEPIHQIRVGTRRLRAVLRIFADIMDEQWAAELEAELRWVAHLLGTVRDLDVLRERIRTAAKPRDRRAMIYVQRILASRHREAQAVMGEGLKSGRFDSLLERLQAGALSPEVALQAGEPAVDVLLPELRNAWQKLVRDARKVKPDGDPSKYHHVRKSGKRVRYAAEMLRQDLSDADQGEADKFVKRMKKLQDVLGEHQDSVVATQTLEQLLELRSSHAPGIRNLIKGEKKAEAKARNQFPETWARATEKKHRKWMKRTRSIAEA